MHRDLLFRFTQKRKGRRRLSLPKDPIRTSREWRPCAVSTPKTTKNRKGLKGKERLPKQSSLNPSTSYFLGCLSVKRTNRWQISSKLSHNPLSKTCLIFSEAHLSSSKVRRSSSKRSLPHLSLSRRPNSTMLSNRVLCLSKEWTHLLAPRQTISTLDLKGRILLGLRPKNLFSCSNWFSQHKARLQFRAKAPPIHSRPS